jgi:hypothetical protein
MLFFDGSLCPLRGKKPPENPRPGMKTALARKNI